MSVKALTWAFDQPISATEKVVLLALADYANESGVCWPSIALLVKRAHVGERTVQRSLQFLEDKGFITRERRLRENGSDTSNLYRLMFDRSCQEVSISIKNNHKSSGGVNLAPYGEGVMQTGGEGVAQTGGEGVMQTVPRTTIKNHHIEPSISSDSDFEEFWAAYPKRPNNPRKKAMEAYRKARKIVSQKQLLEAVNLYAAYMEGENPKFIAMAATWLNGERWNCDYDKSSEVVNAYGQIKYVDGAGGQAMASDEDLDALIKSYPGHFGERDRAKRLLAVEMAKGVNLNDICVAADKYRLFCKGPPYEDRRITPSMLEPWLQFKWREMDAYEFCYVGADRIKTVRPKKVKP
jgi:hypothetical protein